MIRSHQNLTQEKSWTEVVVIFVIFCILFLCQFVQSVHTRLSSHKISCLYYEIFASNEEIKYEWLVGILQCASSTFTFHKNCLRELIMFISHDDGRCTGVSGLVECFTGGLTPTANVNIYLSGHHQERNFAAL